MKASIKLVICALILSAMILSSCQNAFLGNLFQPSPTNVPPTLTQTPTPVPTLTRTPTTTLRPTPTLTPTPAFLTIEPGTVEVPILLYHHVTADMKASRYNIDPDKFEAQMKWLYENGYETINVTTLANLIREGGHIPPRPVIITFDDGNLDVYENAYPILKAYGFTATFYVVDQYINGSEMITTDQLKDLIKNGWEIGSHSDHHSNLTAEGVDLAQEIRMAKIETEEKLGLTINSFAYPFGQINETVVDKTIRFGYTSAVGLGESIRHDKSTLFYLNRIEIENGYSMEKFVSLLPWSGHWQ